MNTYILEVLTSTHNVLERRRMHLLDVLEGRGAVSSDDRRLQELCDISRLIGQIDALSAYFMQDGSEADAGWDPVSGMSG